MPTTLGLPRQVTLGALALDQVDDYGVTWVTLDLAGWRSSPASTLQVTQRPADHGGWASPSPKLTPRHLDLRALIDAPSPAALTAAYDRLIAAVGIGALTLTVVEDGTTRQATAWRDGEILPVEDTGTLATYSVPLLLPDPRRYAPAVTVSLLLPATSGGLSWPVTWPISWPATVVSGDAALAQPGNIAAAPVITIYGPTSGTIPLTTPLVTFTSQVPDGLGGFTTVTSVLTYASTIGVGDWLVIDCAARTVLYNGQSTRRGLLQVSGGWPAIPPGGGQATFRAASYDTTSRVQVTYRPAWM